MLLLPLAPLPVPMQVLLPLLLLLPLPLLLDVPVEAYIAPDLSR
jgi:hypothetical protein